MVRSPPPCALGGEMKRLLIAFCILSLAALACGSDSPKTVDDYMQEFGGNVDVYNRILSLTDCSALQSEFDQADENLQLQSPGTPQYQAGIGYMQAADDHMKSVGCYEQSNSPPTADLSLIIAQTSNAAFAQTQLASSPTSFSTSTFLPTLTQPVIPTPITIATSADGPVPTNTFIFILPTLPPPSGGTCSCSDDLYNCTTDFSTQTQAQACYEFCISQGVGDVHQLDGNDKDGRACESLP